MQSSGRHVDVDAVRPARCLPTEICCQRREMTPTAETRRAIQSSPDLSTGRAPTRRRAAAGAGGEEPRRRRGHVQRLVRALVVVFVDPRIQLLPGPSAWPVNTLPVRNSSRSVRCHRSILPVVVGTAARSAGGRCRSPGRSGRTAPRPRPVPEPSGEHLPVVRQHLLRNPVRAQRLREMRTHGTARSPGPSDRRRR